MTKRLAILPARGGSKRIPRKNIRDFCGRPMIAHSLDCARDSGLFETIHVSTDDPAIDQLVSDLGYPPEFTRPFDLADDQTPLIPVLQWVVQRYRERHRSFDEVWLLMACAPLIRPRHLHEMAGLMAELGDRCQALMAIAPFPAPVERGYRLGPDQRVTPVAPDNFIKRSQDLPTTYHDAGCVDVFRPEFLLSSDRRDWAHMFHGYRLPRWAAIDIDSEEDWQLAEAVYRGMVGDSAD